MTERLPAGTEDPDLVPRPLVGLTIRGTPTAEGLLHRHDKAELLYVISGVITVQAATGIWTVPPRCAFWLPKGVEHMADASGHFEAGALYVVADLAERMPGACCIVFVQPLLRELILRFIRSPQLYPEGDSREARLAAVLLDELQAAPVEPLHLPFPADRRLRRLTEAVREQPSLRLSLEEWGSRVGASSRTLSRLLRSETGMSFVRWRQQLHIGLTLQHLAMGRSVATIAHDLGYESVSAFIAMFRRLLGTTPARYFSEAMGAKPDQASEGVVLRMTPDGITPADA
ncbi:AraC family transcriptional regulator [Rhizorhabdus histidinilytica]|uniref:AraC-type DNA-binding protein n=1 Tax=Rhizorhabdus histidinilytica TaxID=439228 RepID=A0A1T5F1Z3_9SPHN|nr:helix-turn-helix transcriptional regulator [Rhizorhabdus histidinilytica]SKB90146.1 AraC-type DNA-binding protein [Rhizorhabdus histidinilytica]